MFTETAMQSYPENQEPSWYLKTRLLRVANFERLHRAEPGGECRHAFYELFWAEAVGETFR